jgi:cyclohexanone monooxygenase
MAATITTDALIVGAGFSGMYMLHKLRGVGIGAQVVEAGSDVGGTWYWNRYPGARVDIQSLEYSFGFDEALEQDWRWSERYAPQPELLRYAGHVAERFDLKRDIAFNTRVTAAQWDDGAQRWAVTTDTGAAYDCRFLILATGCLSIPTDVTFPGIDDFKGSIAPRAGRTTASISPGNASASSAPGHRRSSRSRSSPSRQHS